MRRIEAFYDNVLTHPVIPDPGGDHTLTLPVLRSIARKHGPSVLFTLMPMPTSMIHMFGESIAHGTTFRRAFEEGLIDPDHTSDRAARHRVHRRGF